MTAKAVETLHLTRQTIAIPADDGAEIDAFLATPDGPATAGIILLDDPGGVSAGPEFLADELTGRGFTVCAPDLEGRAGIELTGPGAVGTEPEMIAQAAAAFDYDRAVDDIAAVMTALTRHTEHRGRIAVVGYGVGGTLAYLAATRLKISAAVAYYGSQIHNFVQEGRHLDCPIVFHLGERDETHSVDDRNRIFAALIGIPHVSIYTYDAGHGFAHSQRPEVFDAAASELAHQRSLALLDNLS